MKMKLVRRFCAAAIVVCTLYTLVVSAMDRGNSSAVAPEEPEMVILGLEEESKVKQIAEEIQNEDGSVQPLEEFLDLLICGRCSRQCSLMALQCNKGERKKELQTEYYEEAVALISTAEVES